MNKAGSPPANEALTTAGTLAGVGAYLWWGFAPIYFKAVAHVTPLQVLAHRVAWSLLLLGMVITLMRRRGELARAWRRPAVRGWLVVSSLLVACNWLTFIHAISTKQTLQASLGYFINPLINVLLGLILLMERPRPVQWGCVALAAAGVAYLTIRQGGVPMIALILAVSFAFYGLVRKHVAVDSLSGLFIETAILAPLAVSYLLVEEWRGTGAWVVHGPNTEALLALSGVITAVPLLLFTFAARRLMLTTIGFLQYLAPTLQFLVAVVLFDEKLQLSQLAAFACIWTALAIYSIEAWCVLRRTARLSGQAT